MENHPIPQDVTGFQFKLIGEMTVKQFAYLAGGVVLAWVTFASPLFWLINFLKAFITPNQFVFQKIGYVLLPEVHVAPKQAAAPTTEPKNTLSEKNLQKYLNSLPKTPKNSLDEKEMRFLGTLPIQNTMN